MKPALYAVIRYDEWNEPVIQLRNRRTGEFLIMSREHVFAMYSLLSVDIERLGFQ
jgi:hypothetical protein